MPTESSLLAGLLVFLAAALWGASLIVRAISASVAKQIKQNDEKRQIELNDLRNQVAANAASHQFVLSTATKLGERVDKQDRTIAELHASKESLTRQLEEARGHSIERDRKIGELQASLDATAKERDQEREQRKTTELQRDGYQRDLGGALAQVTSLKDDLETFKARVVELEKRQEERHEAINKLQAQIADIELARMTAERERDALKVELDVERRKSQQFATPAEPTSDKPEATTA